MSKKNGKTQKTKPEGEGPPTDIPVPTKGEVFRDLAKVAKPKKKERPA